MTGLITLLQKAPSSLTLTLAASQTEGAGRVAGTESRCRIRSASSPAPRGKRTAFWWVAGIFAGGAIVGGLLFRRGPLRRDDGQVQQDAGVMAETEAGPVLPA